MFLFRSRISFLENSILKICFEKNFGVRFLGTSGFSKSILNLQNRRFSNSSISDCFWKSMIFFLVRKFWNLKSIQNFDNHFLVSDFWIRFRAWDSFQFSVICLPELENIFLFFSKIDFRFPVSENLNFVFRFRILFFIKSDFENQFLVSEHFVFSFLDSDFEKRLSIFVSEHFVFQFRISFLENRISKIDFRFFDFRKCCISILDLHFENQLWFEKKLAFVLGFRFFLENRIPKIDFRFLVSEKFVSCSRIRI